MNSRLRLGYWYEYLDARSSLGAKLPQYKQQATEIYINVFQLSMNKQIQALGKIDTTHQGETYRKGIGIDDRIVVGKDSFIVTSVNDEGRMAILGLKNEIL